MKVTAKWKYHNNRKYELKEIKTEYCCSESESSDAIQFGEVDTILNTDESVNIASCAPYPEGAVWDEEPIKFCPFCGKKITIEII